MTNEDAGDWALLRGSLVYPLPVAIACGRVRRARNAAGRVSACIKGAEVLTRYLAAIALASFAARDEQASEKRLSELKADLSFGSFLTTVQEVAALAVPHPAAPLLAQGFKSKKTNNVAVRGSTDQALVDLLVLRNSLGHRLVDLNEGVALTIETKDRPYDKLIRALSGVAGLLSRPLFVIEDHRWTPEAIVGCRLLLMGDSPSPTPDFVKFSKASGGIARERAPYLALGKHDLLLPPALLWEIDERQQGFTLFLLDAVADAGPRYCTIDGSERTEDAATGRLIHALVSGQRRPAEDAVVLTDGRTIAQEWDEKRARREDAGRKNEGWVDWARMDQAALAWYANLLEASSGNPHETIQNRLLDGRAVVAAHELRQLTLLFGRPADVRAELKRDVLDLRVIDPMSLRPAERDLIESDNLLEGLRRAVRFFAKRTEMSNFTPEDLTRTDGSLDYIALREVLVNQIIHQDYTDPSAAGQVDICATRLTVFNTGYSLVAPDKLLDGGKSQSRNPLIARALRSIGFAEIGGSGIRALHRACQKANRKPPVFESDVTGNTFTLTMDWSTGEGGSDKYWMTLVGARLDPSQARVLGALADLPAATIGVLQTATGLGADQLVKALDWLLFQALVQQDESNYRLADHIRGKLG